RTGRASGRPRSRRWRVKGPGPGRRSRSSAPPRRPRYVGGPSISTTRPDRRGRAASSRKRRRSCGLLLAETTLTHGVATQGSQKVHFAEIGPVHVSEVELGVRALPEQEPGEPLLAAGPDDQIGIRLALRVEMLGDVVDVEYLGQLLQRPAGLGVLVEQRPDRVGDFAATAGADGDVGPRSAGAVPC